MSGWMQSDTAEYHFVMRLGRSFDFVCGLAVGRAQGPLTQTPPLDKTCALCARTINSQLVPA